MINLTKIVTLCAFAIIASALFNYMASISPTLKLLFSNNYLAIVITLISVGIENPLIGAIASVVLGLIFMQPWYATIIQFVAANILLIPMTLLFVFVAAKLEKE